MSVPKWLAEANQKQVGQGYLVLHIRLFSFLLSILRATVSVMKPNVYENFVLYSRCGTAMCDDGHARAMHLSVPYISALCTCDILLVQRICAVRAIWLLVRCNWVV